ncbi:MAG: inositol monophosphatase [Bacteroidales bacterium]|nr:inositol monophosphatase [Bacteroidales bacterium]
MDLENICYKVTEIAREVGGFIRQEKDKISTEIIESKGLHDFVTYVDKEAELRIVNKLMNLVPNAGFIVEENTSTEAGNVYNWVVDPLDGTTNFIHGISPFAISIALLENDDVVLGVVYEISLHECFYAWKGSKAFLNGNEIRVSETAHVEDSLISTGFPYYDFKRMPEFLQSLDYFMRNSHGVRRLGSAATDLAYVACGRFSAFYEYSLSPWDVAAGALLVEQAGGKVSDFKGKRNYIFGKEIIASGAKVYTEFFEDVNKFMVK